MDSIDEMLYHLYYMSEENVVAELEKEVPENWHANFAVASKIMTEHRDKFFELFSAYFYELWN